MIRRLFSPPFFEQEEKNFRAKFINIFAWSIIAILLFALIPQLIHPKNFTIAVFSGLIMVMAMALYLLHRRNVDASGIIIIVLGWLGVSAQALTADGVKDVIVVAFLALGILASIIVNWRAGGFVILSGIGMIWVLALLQVNNVFAPSSQNPIPYARDLSFVFVAVSILIYVSTTSMQNAIHRATVSEQDLVKSNQDLQELNQGLEDRVAMRTAELEMANQRNERRARQFEAIAQVARATTSIQDEDTLLARLAQVISEQFGFYHVGIFLLDDQHENAVLRASNSEGGQRMLSRRHSLKVGQVGIVGHVAASGNPRIALDVEEDTAFRDNPDLPDTRSELALPLKDANQIIGVLDVQSTEANAFLPEDTETLYTLANQVTIAMQNARSHEATHRLLEEAQKTSESYVKEAWRLIRSQEKSVGYMAVENTLKPLERLVDYSYLNKAISHGEPWIENGENGTLVVPIHLRGEVVGVLDVRVPMGHDWDPDEVDIARAVADRLSLALESATLLKTTQRRAEIERLTADISGKIGASVNMRNVLQTAVEELGRVLPGSEVVIQFSRDKQNDIGQKKV
jgi:GAF domain-containing protein